MKYNKTPYHYGSQSIVYPKMLKNPKFSKAAQVLTVLVKNAGKTNNYLGLL